MLVSLCYTVLLALCSVCLAGTLKPCIALNFKCDCKENPGCTWFLELSSNSVHHFFILKNSFVFERFVHIIFRCQYFCAWETDNATVVPVQGMPFLALVQSSRCNIPIVVLQFCLIGCMEMDLVLNVLLGYVELSSCHDFNLIFLCHLGGLALNASVHHWGFSLTASLNSSGLFCL